MPSDASDAAQAKPAPVAELSREERDAAERKRMLDAIAEKQARRAALAPGGWERIIGSDARCDNPKCRIRGQGSHTVYRILHDSTSTTHATTTTKGGLVQHATTRRSNAYAINLCEPCKLRQMVHEHGLDELLDDDNRLPPLLDTVALTKVALTPERYEALRLAALNERANPTEPVEVPGEEHMRRRQRKADESENLTALPMNAVG